MGEADPLESLFIDACVLAPLRRVCVRNVFATRRCFRGTVAVIIDVYYEGNELLSHVEMIITGEIGFGMWFYILSLWVGHLLSRGVYLANDWPISNYQLWRICALY